MEFSAAVRNILSKLLNETRLGAQSQILEESCHDLELSKFCIINNNQNLGEYLRPKNQ